LLLLAAHLHSPLGSCSCSCSPVARCAFAFAARLLLLLVLMSTCEDPILLLTYNYDVFNTMIPLLVL